MIRAVDAARSTVAELRGEVRALLEPRLASAVRAARASGRSRLVSASVVTRRVTDPSALITASRRPGDDWFCFEQPDRDGTAIAALGSVRAIEARGEGRFGEVQSAWRRLVAEAAYRPGGGPPGSGLACFGGFAFAPRGGSTPPWEGFSSGSLIVPELSLARRCGEAWLTLNAEVAPDDLEADVLGRVQRRLEELRERPLPLPDPALTGRYEVVSPMSPSHYEEAVARAVSRIRDGELEKIVLAREVEVHAPVAHDPPAVFSMLRQAFPSCFVYAVGRGEATFLGASPELLMRREGQRVSTVALAGSARRSADPAVDDHLGEQLLRSHKDIEENAIVARRIMRTLSSHAVWVTAAPEPALVRVANIQHLGRPIRAQLRSSMGALELAGLLHPTPAVGAEPAAAAAELIPALEGLDRGWYAGVVGWTDAAEDGEFCVALRGALLREKVARCFAGCGIVRDSDPAAELAETELKLQVMLPLLAG